MRTSIANNVDLEHDVAVAAQAILCTHPRLLPRVSSLRFQYANGTLRIEGHVRTYYEKQLLQEALRGLSHSSIDNRATVHPQ